MKILLTLFVISALVAGLFLLQSKIVEQTEERQSKLQEEWIVGQNKYRINVPDKTLFMSSELQEISGLAYSPEKKQLIAVQDEDGIIYYINSEDGDIESQVRFGIRGDYEGVEKVNMDLYVVSSKGDIHYWGENDQTGVIETFLNSSYDIEGLGYNPTDHTLILGCKSSGKQETLEKSRRALYSFDITQRELRKEPYLVLDCIEISKKLKRKKTTPYFSTSGLCVDSDGSIFLISSVGGAIIVVKDGKIQNVANLDRALHVQPEGIAIDDNGILYIATEARKGVAKIYGFNPH